LQSFQHQLADHLHEARMGPHRGGAPQRQSKLGAEVARLFVEIVQHLDVVGEKADRRDHHAGHALCVECP
jgi:hypothetical protein